MEEILELLENNSHLSPQQIAVMLNKSEEEIKVAITEMEKNHIIIGYNTLINWEKTQKEKLTALIEVRVMPQRGEGFDRVAERIYKFPEVKSCYLMSGGYDICVIIEGKTMKEIAMFVSQKLALLDSITGTATHFVLKKYKDKGLVFEDKNEDDREAVFV